MDSAPAQTAPLEISVEEAQQLLATAPHETVIVDVREPFEIDICQIPGATLIPLRQIPEQLAELPRDKHLLMLCHHGSRSQRATEFLRAKGLARVSNIEGGIAAWAERIDPAMRQY